MQDLGPNHLYTSTGTPLDCRGY